MSKADEPLVSDSIHFFLFTIMNLLQRHVEALEVAVG